MLAPPSAAGGSHFCLRQLTARQAAAVPAAPQVVQVLPTLLNRSITAAHQFTRWLSVQRKIGSSIAGPCFTIGGPSSAITPYDTTPPAQLRAPNRMRSGIQSGRAASAPEGEREASWIAAEAAAGWSPPPAPVSVTSAGSAPSRTARPAVPAGFVPPRPAGSSAAARAGETGARRATMTVAAAIAARPAGQSATRRYRRIPICLPVSRN